MPDQDSLIEIRDNELAQLRQELAQIRGETYEPPVDEEPVLDDADIFAEPRSLRDDYIKELEAFVKNVKQTCRQHRIDYVPMTTSASLEVALSAYLAGRLAMRGK